MDVVRAGDQVSGSVFKGAPRFGLEYGHAVEKLVYAGIEREFRVRVGAHVGSDLGAEIRREAWTR